VSDGSWGDPWKFTTIGRGRYASAIGPSFFRTRTGRHASTSLEMHALTRIHRIGEGPAGIRTPGEDGQ
jgi:hypothetical protein